MSARFFQGELGRWRTDAARAPEDLMADVIDRELGLSEARAIVVDEFERRYVAHMLARHGNVRDAARASGVAVPYFQMLRTGLEK